MSKERGWCLKCIAQKPVRPGAGTEIRYEKYESEIREIQGYRYWVLKEGSKYAAYDFSTGLVIQNRFKTVKELNEFIDRRWETLVNLYKNSFYKKMTAQANEYRSKNNIELINAD